MLRQHVRSRTYPYPFHEAGEVVLAAFGNFLEARETCTRKIRPVILLRTSMTQHMFAGLTTQPIYQTTGGRRPVLPKPACMGLDERISHLWSPRPAFVSRLDIRRHLGWIDRDVCRFLARNMNMDAITATMLWHAATLHGPCTKPKPR